MLDILFSVRASGTLVVAFLVPLAMAVRTLASIAALGKIEQLRSTPSSALVPSPAASLEDDLEGYSDRVGGDAAQKRQVGGDA